MTTAADMIRGLKSIAEEIQRCTNWSPSENTLRRYSRRRPEHNPLPVYAEIGGAVAISVAELHAWIERERRRRSA